MYVALAERSKITACMRCDNLHRIFRKLRLAVFGRMCRLPIGLGSLWAGRRGWFPILRYRMSGIASGIVTATAGVAPLSLRQSQQYSGPFLAGCPQSAEKSERQPRSLATHRAGRAYYIYVASCKCQPRHFDWQPQGGFWQTDRFLQAIPAKPRNRQQREVGAIAPLRLAA